MEFSLRINEEILQLHQNPQALKSYSMGSVGMRGEKRTREYGMTSETFTYNLKHWASLKTQTSHNERQTKLIHASTQVNMKLSVEENLTEKSKYKRLRWVEKSSTLKAEGQDSNEVWGL